MPKILICSKRVVAIPNKVRTKVLPPEGILHQQKTLFTVKWKFLNVRSEYLQICAFYAIFFNIFKHGSLQNIFARCTFHSRVIIADPVISEPREDGLDCFKNQFKRI